MKGKAGSVEWEGMHGFVIYLAWPLLILHGMDWNHLSPLLGSPSYISAWPSAHLSSLQSPLPVVLPIPTSKLQYHKDSQLRVSTCSTMIRSQQQKLSSSEGHPLRGEGIRRKEASTLKPRVYEENWQGRLECLFSSQHSSSFLIIYVFVNLHTQYASLHSL